MHKIIRIEVPDILDNRDIISKLIGIPGAKIETVESAERWVGVAEAAEIVGYSYSAFRRLAVEQGKIPFQRPAGRRGHPRFLVSDLLSFKNKRPGRKTKEVSIL